MFKDGKSIKLIIPGRGQKGSGSAEIRYELSKIAMLLKENTVKGTLHMWAKEEIAAHENNGRPGYTGYRWGSRNTPLEHYAQPLNLNLREHLETAAKIARAEGRKIRILDVGMYDGEQWLGFTNQYSDCVEFFGTVLSMEPVKPGMKGFAAISAASQIAKKFENGSFDFVVFHDAAYDEEFACIKAAALLLKAGGEMIASGSYSKMPQESIVRKECPCYEIIPHGEENFINRAYHLKKVAEPKN